MVGMMGLQLQIISLIFHFAHLAAPPLWSQSNITSECGVGIARTFDWRARCVGTSPIARGLAASRTPSGGKPSPARQSAELLDEMTS